MPRGCSLRVATRDRGPQSFAGGERECVCVCSDSVVRGRAVLGDVFSFGWKREGAVGESVCSCVCLLSLSLSR